MEDLDPKYRENPFRVPENYFEELDERVLSRIHESRSEKKPIFRIWRKSLIPIAASILIAAMVMILKQDDDSGKFDLSTSLSQLDSSELAVYENSVDINDEEFMDIVPAETIDSIYYSDIVLNETGYFDQEDLDALNDEYSILTEDSDI